MNTPLSPRLSWSQIAEMFEGEWVELVNCRWQEDASLPYVASVRHHASDRAALMEMIRASSHKSDGIVLYVSPNYITASSLVRFQPMHPA